MRALPVADVRVAPLMMLLMARAATVRLSTGLAGLYGWCRLSDQAISPPWDGWIGSRPLRPVDWSTNPGLLPLVSSAKTQSTCCVSLAQAKFSPLGSAATSGLAQASLIWAWTAVTLAG